MINISGKLRDWRRGLDTGGEDVANLKICQLCAVDFTLEKLLLPLVDGMTKEGWSVISVCSPGARADDLHARGYLIDTVTIERSLNPVGLICSFIRLTMLFKKHRFDIVHVHTPIAAFIGRVAAYFSGVRLIVYTAHGFYFHENMSRWKYKLYVQLEKIAGEFTDILFTQSYEDAATAITERIMPANKIIAIGNGIDCKEYDPGNIRDSGFLRRTLRISNSAYLIGMVARQVREKGVVEFLLAAEKIASKYPQACFLIVGERLPSDHSHGVEFEYMRAKNILKDRLISVQTPHSMPQMMGIMDLFCLPSWREGMPRTIIEAMMMSKPVVATNIRGCREEVVDEKTGLLVKVRSPDDLSVAFGRFLENPSWGTKLGANGRLRALELYDESKIINLQITRIKDELGRLKK